jgi:hypothetical protein
MASWGIPRVSFDPWDDDGFDPRDFEEQIIEEYYQRRRMGMDYDDIDYEAERIMDMRDRERDDLYIQDTTMNRAAIKVKKEDEERRRENVPMEKTKVYLEPKDFKDRTRIKLRQDLDPGKEYYCEGQKLKLVPEILDLKDKKVYAYHQYSDDTLEIRVFDPNINSLLEPEAWSSPGINEDFTFACLFEKMTNNEISEELLLVPEKKREQFQREKEAEKSFEELVVAATEANHQTWETGYSEMGEIIENENNNEEKEVVKMSKLNGMLTKIFGEIGEIKDGSLALTFNCGVAVKRADGDFLRYNTTTNTLENQVDFIIPESEKFMMLMPSPTVKPGDIVKKNKKYYQVLALSDGGALEVINFEDGSQTTILKETNIFNMNYYTTVISFMTGINGGDNNPNGGFNPMMMLLLDKDDNKEMDMPMLMMMTGMFGGGQANGQVNPMLMYMVLGNKKDGESNNSMKDIMMMSMFMGGNSPFGNMFGAQTPAVVEPVKTQQDQTILEIVKGQAQAMAELQQTVVGLAKTVEALTKPETPADN